MASHAPALGIDFGTSNSAAGYLRAGEVCLVEMAPGETGLPTTFFFDFDTRRTLIGTPANRALLDGTEGRFMRALKRVLGTPLMHEPRQILNERVTFVEIIGRFLGQIKARAEAQAGHPFHRVLSGRPVVFHGTGDPREDQAERDLTACYDAAGFTEVAFLPEPEAAAIASGASGAPGEVGLVVDIGGGTSDFSLFRSTGGGVEILANHGLRIGGTDFDRAIGIDRVMPLLGRGTKLRKVLGDGLVDAPVAIFNDLATWEKIPFLYTAQNRRAAAEMMRLAEAPKALARLHAVLRDALGHDLAFAVEAGKIAANDGVADAVIALDEVERGLAVPLSAAMLDDLLRPFARDLDRGVRDTLRAAGLDADRVGRVVYVGGSSRMAMVGKTVRRCLPGADHVVTDVFSAVARGLALATERR